MAVTIKIPTLLQSITDDQPEVQVEGTTVGEALQSLFEEFDELGERLSPDGSLQRFVNVYVGGRDIRGLDGLDTPVSSEDEVKILPAVAGG